MAVGMGQSPDELKKDYDVSLLKKVKKARRTSMSLNSFQEIRPYQAFLKRYTSGFLMTACFIKQSFLKRTMTQP